MLVLTRRIRETLIIGNDTKITVLGIHGNHVRIGIDAPVDVTVHREEVHLRLRQQSQNIHANVCELASAPVDS